MAPLNWIFFPDFRCSNPYQALLADALSHSADVRPGTITDALEIVDKAPTVFHVHWEDALYLSAQSEQNAREITDGFVAELTVFRDLGGRIVWTMHNAVPHQDTFPALSARLRRVLAQHSDIVHVHGQLARTIAQEAGASDDRILVIPHPNIASAYPNDVNGEAARRYFSLDKHETVFAFLGAIRPYKGVEMLLQAFSEVHSKQPATHLILGGRQANNREGRYFIVAPGVLLIPHFVDDGIIQYVLNAADYVVLPYNRILTSGAVALALGFGRPVIVPDLPTLLEVVQSGREALTFRAGDQADLVRAMLEACEHEPDVRFNFQQQARQQGEATIFTDLATALAERIHAP